MPDAHYAWTLLGLAAAIAVAASGCATHSERIADVRRSFYAGDAATAARLLAQRAEDGTHDADVLKLDLAVVRLFEGAPQDAERLLRQVRDRFDYFEQLDVREQLAALAADDRKVAYAGEDYEKVLLRLMLAFADLIDDGDDALAYAFQTIQKQQEIIEQGIPGLDENPKERYRQVAAAAYLYALLRESTYTDYDDALRWYQRVAQWAPGYTPITRDLERARDGVFAQPGHGVVYVFSFVDRGPYKVEAEHPASTAAIGIASALISVAGPYTLPPQIAPVKIPRVVAPPPHVKTVNVRANGRSLGQTETLTDIAAMAVEQFEAIRPYIVAKAIVRRALKQGAVYAVKDALDARDPVVQVALDIAGVAWQAAERADTRCWSLLPGRIQAVRIELPAGQHRLTLQAESFAGVAGPERTVDITVAPGRTTFVLAYYPALRPVGRVLVSSPR